MYILAYFSAWGAILTGIWLLFSKAEDLAKTKTKTDIASWLKNSDLEEKLANWPTTFASIFDGIFGEKHFSWRRFSRSCVATCASALILTLLWWVVDSEGFIACFTVNETTHVTLDIITMLFLLFALNLIPDYFSLFETRWILRRLEKTKSSMIILGYLIMDFVATASIFIIGYVLVCIMFFPVNIMGTDYGLNPLDSPRFLYDGIAMRSVSSGYITLGIFFYSTFFTSIWIYMYVISGMVVKVGVYLKFSVGFLGKFFNIDDEPIRFMGYVCMVIASLIFLIVAFAKLLF